MQPTDVEKHDPTQNSDGYTIEYYRWWGHVPLINQRRHFISVVYVGTEPRRFSSHHRENPPKEALPIVEEPVAGADEPLTPQTTQDNPPAAAETPPAADNKDKEASKTTDK